MEFLVNKRQYILSERKAADFLELAASANSLDEKDVLFDIISAVRGICDSLKATAKDKNIFTRYRYKKFLGQQGITLLLNSLTINEIKDAWLYVNELEGNLKKKVLTAEKEKLQDEK